MAPLTKVLVALLALSGAAFTSACGHAAAHRRHKSWPWGQMAFAGVISLVLGALLVWALPHAGLIVPGVFLAFNLIAFGASLLAVAFTKQTANPS